MKKVSFIIPVFNEEKNLPALFEEIDKIWQSFLNNKYQLEVILVDDGSLDQSWIEILKKQSSGSFYFLKGLKLSRNFGKEAATTAGIYESSGDCLIMIDADLQHPIEKVKEFLEKWEQGGEVVIGLRKGDKEKALFNRVGAFLFYRIMNLIAEPDSKIIPYATDFRLIDKKVAREYKKFSEHNRITRGLIDWLGFKRDFIEFEANSRLWGKPAYTKIKLIKLALSGFVSNSLFPLKIAGYLGVLITFFSGLLGLFIFIEKYLLNDPLELHFSGPATLAVINLFLIGIVLSCLGLIALYIGKIHYESMNRPLFIIQTKTSENEENQRYI